VAVRPSLLRQRQFGKFILALVMHHTAVETGKKRFANEPTSCSLSKVGDFAVGEDSQLLGMNLL